MEISLHGVLFAVVLGSCLAVWVQGDCGVSSADDCLPDKDLQQLPTNVSFCSSAASLIYEVRLCLDECNFTATENIQTFLTLFENLCSDMPGCKDIGRFYTNFQSCFDSSGGLSRLIDDIVSAFNSKENTGTFCPNLSHGKFCMNTVIASCPLLSDLINTAFVLYDQFAIAQHICGSENVPLLSDNSNCANSKDMIANINRKCDISCSISLTPNLVAVCSFLQFQVDCFLSESKGCTEVERQFILPRLNTYAFANLVLKCPTPIRLQGVNIQPTGLNPESADNSRCTYIDQLNACFNFGLSDSVRPNVVELLINGKFDTAYFCDLEVNGILSAAELLTKCSTSFLSCRLPVANLYERGGPDYNDPYNVALAPFPLDAWGLNTILSTLQCPNSQPPTLCKLSASTNIAPRLAPLHPTPSFTKRTTPVKKTSTPKKGSPQGNPGNEPLKQQADDSSLDSSTAARIIRPTPTLLPTSQKIIMGDNR